MDNRSADELCKLLLKSASPVKIHFVLSWLLIGLMLTACDVIAAEPTEPPGRVDQSVCELHPGDPRYQLGLVKRVVDGDTIVVMVDGREYRVRYIGVDAPESVKPDTPPEYYGVEASDYNRQLVAGKDVCLERDVSDTDKFDRWLRYVYVDTDFINARLVREGYARAVLYRPDVKYQSILIDAEREAQQARRGLWAKH